MTHDPGSIVTLQHPDGQPWAILAQRRGNGWARVSIERGGNVVASSDYGTYSYWWTHPGGDEAKPLMTRVARFLCDCDRSYLIDKFNGPRPKVFDGQATEDAIRRRIIELRRRGDIDKFDARRGWDETEEIEREADFAVWLDGTDIPHAYELARYRIDSDVCHFVDNVVLGWFIPLLRRWLQEEDRKAWPRLCVQGPESDGEPTYRVIDDEEPGPDARVFRCRRVPGSKAIDAEQLTKLIAESVGEDVARWVYGNTFADWDDVGARARPSAPDALKKWADASLVVDAWEVGPEATEDEIAKHLLYDPRMAAAINDMIESGTGEVVMLDDFEENEAT